MKQAFIDEAKWKGTDNPQLGDVVCFDCNRDGVTDQVGIVKSVNDDGTIHIIEHHMIKYAIARETTQPMTAPTAMSQKSQRCLSCGAPEGVWTLTTPA